MVIYPRASRFIAGAVGQPGNRTFFVYVEVPDVGAAWYLLEKQQVAALGTQSLEAIEQMGLLPDETLVETIVGTQMNIPAPDPTQVSFRIASMALSLDEHAGLVVVMLTDGEDETEQFGVTSEQLRAMALHALDEVQGGRPICPKCHLPEEPTGHHCPSTNGHRTLG